MKSTLYNSFINIYIYKCVGNIFKVILYLYLQSNEKADNNFSGFVENSVLSICIFWIHTNFGGNACRHWEIYFQISLASEGYKTVYSNWKFLKNCYIIRRSCSGYAEIRFIFIPSRCIEIRRMFLLHNVTTAKKGLVILPVVTFKILFRREKLSYFRYEK